uniref:Uncharacterized protein n=1 Tax=Oryza punctata TaxID=4537 RepID=A0A0E0KD10_ORYPU
MFRFYITVARASQAASRYPNMPTIWADWNMLTCSRAGRARNCNGQLDKTAATFSEAMYENPIMAFNYTINMERPSILRYVTLIN